MPGVSRMGIALTAARLLNFKRTDAAKISFFLSIPILAAVSIFFYMKMTTGQQMASQPPPQEGMPDMTKMMKYMIY